MQLGALGFFEQSGSAGTDQQGEPVALEQSRMAPEVKSWRWVHP
jgi:hypothetical protein